MAKEIIHRKPTSLLSPGKKDPRSGCLWLAGLVFAAAVAALIGAVGAGAQNNFQDKTSTGVVFPGATNCTDINVVVYSPDQRDALIACDGARDAIAFLGLIGLDVTEEFAVEIVPSLPIFLSSSAAGFYHEPEGRVLVLTYEKFRKFETWFGVPIDRSMYRSLVAHEVAHLVADFNFTIPDPSIQAKEYIAYVTQFSTMEPALRKRVMSHFPGKAFDGDWQMSATIYMFDCMGFGVRAYRHFLEVTDGHEYLHKILNGQALIE